MRTFNSSAGLPSNLSGYGCWLQYRHFGEWVTLCPLRATDLRATLRWLDHHPECATVRVLIEALPMR